MTHGKDLTEYSSFELSVLLNAVARETDHVSANYDGRKSAEYLNVLTQWKTKIIEAKAQVRLKEIQTEN